MPILALHFGHDASVAVFDEDGKLLINVCHERVFERKKHAFGLSPALIRRALLEAGVDLRDISHCAVTSTQCYELFFGANVPESEFDIRYEKQPEHTNPGTLWKISQGSRSALAQGYVAPIREALRSGTRYYLDMFPYGEEFLSKLYCVRSKDYLTDYVSIPELWDKPYTLKTLASTNWRPVFRNPEIRDGFHFPIVVTLFGIKIPGYIVQHHMAHAAYSFYSSDCETMAVISHDGGFYKRGPNNGMFAIGEGIDLWPITPHHLSLGDFYDAVGMHIGFDSMSSPGKVMGLAPYGKPRYFSREFVGNSFDILENLNDSIPARFLSAAASIAAAEKRSIQIDSPLDEFGIDLAASVQKIFEATMVEAALALRTICHSLDFPTPFLGLGGGCALNCPSNSNLARSGIFETVKIYPSVDDSGLAIGVGYFVIHNILRRPRNLLDGNGANDKLLPFTGSLFADAQIKEALDENAHALAVNPASMEEVATSLANGMVIGWFEGRSEQGPRALCHRSILADPRDAENWRRVNEIKSRERWRPFAPVVLEEDFGNYFYGCPADTPYMLFNAKVMSKEIPAVTHVDGTARVQTVSAESGGIFELLNAFKRITGVSVLMNTSFNGPGEPIVDSPKEALRFLLTSKLDGLWIQGHLVTRRQIGLEAG